MGRWSNLEFYEVSPYPTVYPRDRSPSLSAAIAAAVRIQVEGPLRLTIVSKRFWYSRKRRMEPESVHDQPDMSAEKSTSYCHMRVLVRSCASSMVHVSPGESASTAHASATVPNSHKLGK
jgi:hypothetical protein